MQISEIKSASAICIFDHPVTMYLQS